METDQVAAIRMLPTPPNPIRTTGISDMYDTI